MGSSKNNNQQYRTMWMFNRFPSNARSFLLHSTWKFCSSSNTPDPNQTKPTSPLIVSKSAQEAILASDILEQILILKPPTSLSEPSLRERLIDLKPIYKDVKYDDEVIKDSLKIFTQGVPLTTIKNPFIKSQSSKNGSRAIKNWDLLAQGNSKQGKESQKLFLSNPTTLATLQIVQKSFTRRPSIVYVDIFHSGNNFILGGPHTGKTSTFHLICHLSAKIHKYLYEASLTSSKKQKDAEKAQEIQKIRTRIFLHYPRFWYCDIKLLRAFIQQNKNHKLESKKIDIVKEEIQKFFKEFILEQAVELPEKIKKKLRKIKKIKDFTYQLKKSYDGKVYFVAILDNMHEVTFDLRRHRYLSKRPLDQKKQFTPKDEFSLKILVEAILSFKQAGWNFFYSSSEGIDWRMISDQPKQSSLNIYTCRQHFLQQSQEFIQFHKNLMTAPGQIEFFHHFWFEIEKILLANQTKHIPEFKRLFYISAEGKQLKSYFNFSFIQKYLERQKDKLQRISKDSFNNQQAQAFMSEFANNFLPFCTELAYNNLVLYINSGTLEQKAIKAVLADVLFGLAINQHHQKQESYQMEIETVHLQRVIDDRVALQRLFYSQPIDRENFSFIFKHCLFKQPYLIRFNWSVKEYLELAAPLVRPFNLKDTKFTHQRYTKSNQFLQDSMTSRISKIMLPKAVIQLEKIKITIDKTVGIIPFSKNSKIYDSLKEALKEAESNPSKVIVAIPISSCLQNERPIVKFATIQFQSNQSTFYINTFDVCLGNREQLQKIQAQVSQKLEIELRQTSSSYSYHFYHHILHSGLQGMVNQVKVINNLLSISCCSIQKLKFKKIEKQAEMDQRIFETFKTYIANLERGKFGSNRY